MHARTQWSMAVLIVLVSILIAFPIVRLSPSYGAGETKSAQSLGMANTMHSKTMKAHQDSQAELDTARSEAKTPFEQEMVKFGDKLLAEMKAAEDENKQMLATMKAMEDEAHGGKR